MEILVTDYIIAFKVLWGTVSGTVGFSVGCFSMRALGGNISSCVSSFLFRGNFCQLILTSLGLGQVFPKGI